MKHESTHHHQHDKTREQLLEAGLYLFSRRGYDGVSVKDIADRAEANISAISYHFSGKEGLYKACVESFAMEELAYHEKSMKHPTSEEDMRARLRIFVEHIIDKTLTNTDSCRIIWREMEMENPILEDVFKRTFLKMFAIFSGFFATGQKAGYLRDDLDAQAVTMLFMGGIQHALRVENIRKKYFGKTLKDPEIREQLIHTVMEMFFSGMKKQRN